MNYCINKNSLHKTEAVLLLLYINFPFYLKYFMRIQQLTIWCICCCYALININIIIKKNVFRCLQSELMKMSLYFYVLFVLIAFIIPVIHGTTDYSYYKQIVYYSMRLVQYVCVFIFLAKNIKENKLRTYLECFIISCSVYVMISVFMFVNPSFKEFWKRIIFIDTLDESLFLRLDFISRFGLAGFSGFLATFMCTTSVVFSIFLVLQQYKQVFIFFHMIINLFGTFLYGRIGMVSSLLFVLVFVGYYIFKKKKIILLFIIVFCICIIYLLLNYLYYTDPIISGWLDWSFAPFRNLIRTGRFGDASSDMLITKMYFLPENMTVLFGDGKYTGSNGGYYLSTDSGFMRLLLYAGIFTQSIIYFSVFSILISSSFSIRNYFGLEYLFSFFLFFCLFLIFEFKGEICYAVSMVLLPVALFNSKSYSNGIKI